MSGRRQFAYDLPITMPPTPINSLADTFRGVPIYQHVESISAAQSIGIPAKLPSTTPAPFQDNMFGARARAAELQAAKTQSARLSQEDDIPRPTPTPLSAFSRIPNRNKGVKAFVPLILSEETEKNSTGSSAEGETVANSSDSSELKEEIPRAASLPPLRPAQPIIIKPEFDRAITSVNTPQRSRDTHSANFGPKLMYDDHMMNINHNHGFMQPQAWQMPYTGPMMTQHPMPMQNWYDSYAQYQYHEQQNHIQHPPSMPVTPTPKLLHRQASDTVRPDFPKKSTSETPQKLFQTPETIPAQGYRFGPDDLSPTKMEIKEAARREYFAKHPEAIAIDARKTSSQYAQDGDGPERQTERLQEILQRRSRFYSEVERDSTDRDAELSLLTDEELLTEYESEGGAWPYLGQSQYQPQSSNVSYETAPEQSNKGMNQTGRQHAGEANLGSIGDGRKIGFRAPPGLKKPVNPLKPIDREENRITNLNFPLMEVGSAEWFDIEPNMKSREKMRRAMAVVRDADMTSSKIDATKNMTGELAQELEDAIEEVKEENEKRSEAVSSLLRDCEEKWSKQGKSQSETQQKLGMIEAIGGIMSALSLQIDGERDRGSRPYYSPPEFMIDRGPVTIGGKSSTSMFEREDQTRAPMRFARDPRYRSTLPGVIGPGENIPRFFQRPRN